jgi:hypothetical protein
MKLPYEVVFEEREYLVIDVEYVKLAEGVRASRVVLPEIFRNIIEDFEKLYGEVKEMKAVREIKDYLFEHHRERDWYKPPIVLIELLTWDEDPNFATTRKYPCDYVMLNFPTETRIPS